MALDGKKGIRTLDTLIVCWFSKPMLSATQPFLLMLYILRFLVTFIYGETLLVNI